MSATCIMGIDPGLNITGYGVLSIEGQRLSVVEAGIIRSKRSNTFGQRLAQIHDGLDEVLVRLKPDCVGLEELYSHYANPTTAIIMGHARGVICLACAKQNLKVHSYAATQVKKF